MNRLKEKMHKVKKRIKEEMEEEVEWAKQFPIDFIFAHTIEPICNFAKYLEKHLIVYVIFETIVSAIAAIAGMTLVQKLL